MGSGRGEIDFFFSTLDLPLDGSLVSFDFVFPSVVFIPANFTQLSVGARFDTSISGFPGFAGAGSTGSLTTIGKNVSVEVGRSMCSCGSFDVGLLTGPCLGPNVNTSALRLSGAHFDVYLPTVTGQMLTTGRVRVWPCIPCQSQQPLVCSSSGSYSHFDGINLVSDKTTPRGIPHWSWIACGLAKCARISSCSTNVCASSSRSFSFHSG